MTDSNIFTLNKPEQNDPLPEVLREGARKMLATAIEAEVAAFIEQHSALQTDEGEAAVKNGYFSETLKRLLGPEAPGLSAATISRLKQDWEQNYHDWTRRDLSRNIPKQWRAWPRTNHQCWFSMIILPKTGRIPEPPIPLSSSLPPSD